MHDLLLSGEGSNVDYDDLGKLVSHLPFIVALSVIGVYKNSGDLETMINVKKWLKDYRTTLPLPYVSKIDSAALEGLVKGLPKFEKETIVLILESFQLGVIPFMAERKIDKAIALVSSKIHVLGL